MAKSQAEMVQNGSDRVGIASKAPLHRAIALQPLIRLFTTRFNQGSILRFRSQNPWNKNLPLLKTTPLDENYGSGYTASLWRPA